MTPNKEYENVGVANESSDSIRLPDDAVIVIGRQFGSGGRRIGKKIASILNINYYDTELLSKAAENLGMNPDIFQEHDEKKPSPLRTMMQGAFGIADNFHSVPLNGEMIYQEQAKVIRDVCRKGACVIVGRTADLILRENRHLLSVFLHSPLHVRAEAILTRKEASTLEEAENMAMKFDKKRESYYNFYRGEKKWGDASNYHLSIDTSVLDEETIAETIINMARKKMQK